MAAPAEYRRRRLRALVVLAVVALLVGVAIGSGAGEEATPPAPVLSHCAKPGTSALQVAGQGVLVRMQDTATPRLIGLARRGEIGGVTLFPSSKVKTSELKAQILRLQTAAESGGNPPLLVTIDQEGGVVKRLPSLPPQVAPYTLGQNNLPKGARLEGKATGFQLSQLGIDADLAPVLDVPANPEQFMVSRAFGSTPAQISTLGLSFARGLMGKGVAATAKHFPGLGRALENTDFAPTTIGASKAALQADLKPFRDAIKAGVPMIMVSLATYPAIGGAKGTPAVLSPAIVGSLLRRQLGFNGVVISDDLLAPAVSTTYSPKRAATLASRAGVDLKLFASKGVDGIAQSLATAADEGRGISASKLAQSCQRVVALKQSIAAGTLLEAGNNPAATDGSGTP